MKNCDTFFRRYYVKFQIENETGLQIILNNSFAIYSISKHEGFDIFVSEVIE